MMFEIYFSLLNKGLETFSPKPALALFLACFVYFPLYGWIFSVGRLLVFLFVHC